MDDEVTVTFGIQGTGSILSPRRRERQNNRLGSNAGRPDGSQCLVATPSLTPASAKGTHRFLLRDTTAEILCSRNCTSIARLPRSAYTTKRCVPFSSLLGSAVRRVTKINADIYVARYSSSLGPAIRMYSSSTT